MEFYDYISCFDSCGEYDSYSDNHDLKKIWIIWWLVEMWEDKILMVELEEEAEIAFIENLGREIGDE
ncbi:unnamed protein product [Blepharisma stoltei]|uniref:Uncharacterized protein n=1 Tax=Blepharisma stoltei TaxID=1481888 RepID=A0AAU9IFC0_9CILI|nr:unnamed protein product [Blepharisma stoltei]